MADPDGYEPQYDFSAYQAANPKRPLPGHELDVELHDISNAIGSTQTALADIRRSDGRLQNGIVDADAIGPTAVGALIEQSTELMEDVLFVVEMYLGQLAEDPETGRDGADLEPSNWYYSTVTEGYRYYTADGWRPMTGVATIRQYRFIMEAGQTDISGLDENGFQYFASGESVAVFKNGAILPKTTGFTTPDNSTITLASAASDGDVVVVLSFEEAVPAELGRLARRLHVADGMTATFALPTGVTSIGQVLSVAVDGVAQNYDTYSMVGSNLVLDSMPRNGERVQITAWTAVLAEDSNTRRAYAFASRSAFIAALGWPWESGAVVSDGTVQYEYLGTGTAIADAPGWVPFGAIYPEHFGANTTPGTTNMQAAIKAAADYAQSILAALYFRAGINYRINTPLNFSTGNHRWVCDSGIGNQGAKILYYGSASLPAVHFTAVDPLLSTATLLNNFYLKGIVFWRPSAGSLRPIVRFTKCQAITIDDCLAWGGFIGWEFVATRNVRTWRMGGSAAGVFAGGAGSALVRVTSVTHSDDGEVFNSYTHNFGASLMGSSEYDATYLIEHADFTTISDGYNGFAQRRVLIRPFSADAHVINVEINGSYFDGGAFPTGLGEAHVKIDNAAGGKVAYVRVNGGIIAQCEYGILIVNPEGVETVTCHGVDFHNSLYNFVRSIGTSTTLDLRIMGGNMTYAARTAAATGDDEYAVCVESFKSVAINGVVARTYAAETQPLFKFGSGTDLQLIGNTASGVTVPVTITGAVTRRIERANACNVSWPDFDDTDYALATPSLKFGGVELVAGGGAYSLRAGDYFRHGNHVTVRGTITLSSKTGAAGALAITLPIAALASTIGTIGAVWVQGMTADALAPSYVLILPAGGGTELQIRKMTTTGAPVGQIITDAQVGATATITYNITYRVA